MAKKLEDAVTSVLTDAQRGSIASAIVEATDDRGHAHSMLERITSAVSKVRGLKGALPKDDVDQIADAARAMYVKRGIEEKDEKGNESGSMRALLSAVRKVARCAPMLRDVDVLDGVGIAGVKKFCTLLQKHEFDADAATKDFTTPTAPNYVRSTAAHIKSLLSMKGNVISDDAKAALAEWALSLRFGRGGKQSLEIKYDARNPKAARTYLQNII